MTQPVASQDSLLVSVPFSPPQSLIHKLAC